MSSPRRETPRRPANSPIPRPTDPVTVLISQGTSTKTPHRRPRPNPSNSAASISSASSSSDNDTIFDVSSRRSCTPSSPFTPLKTTPNSPSRLLFSDEVDNRTSGRPLKEPPSDHEAPERRLYKILSEVEESFPYTPSKKSGQRSRTWRNVPSTERPPLRRQAHIDDVLQHQQKSENTRIPGTFDSHDPEADMAADYSGSGPASPSTDELPQHTDETCQILGEFAGVPTVSYLINQSHKLRPGDWQVLKTIFTNDKQARLDLRHLLQVLRIKIPKPASNSNPPGGLPTKATNHLQKILTFVPWRPKKNPRQINSSIHKCIKKRLRPTKELVDQLTNKPEPGWIYVFESPQNAPGHVKIGKTKDEPQKRLAEWEMCGITPIELEDSDRNPFEHYSVVESLISAELHNQRRTYECEFHHKPVKHGEWYEIENQIALDSVSRWRQWIKYQKPFDDRGFLTPYWHWRVQKVPKSIDNVDWDRWTRPSSWDYLDFQFEQFGQGYYARIKAHLGRKDSQFWLTGGMMVFIVYSQFGLFSAMSGLLALLIL
ncbi:hypothetical protein NA56DRAFT_110304 [Hyaloscypha hepaticicola]|uniref:Bacteriophage T5 Orf172 DNA-binding domain-containing protein n=1 Tax=Hyaloscypha hepaticicola TaxID=2082293 RepID=A0A2J6Q765_9HELO|nr:hypothetical protein NA56DRAFT_110304 [Hyaloscypha hepaticicola]